MTEEREPIGLARLARSLAAVALAIACAACSHLPSRNEAPDSYALPASAAASTTLGKTAMVSVPSGSPSGFQFLPVASAAYEARLALCDQAERSIDVQTFILAGDDTGNYLLDRLQEAAARGVRVRLLVDDLNSAGTDDILAAFAAHRNVEVRLFNPFVVNRGPTAERFLLAINELTRVNHRMHNKLFVADNAIAVFGGRNTGDEYFMRSAASNFVDFDVLAAGEVVADLSRSFDVYWNSAYAYPLAAVVKPRPADAGEARIVRAEPPPLDETIPERLQRYAVASTQLSAGRLELVGARAEVAFDPPDKVKGVFVNNRRGTVRAFAADAMRSADESVLVLSPYFIPGRLGMDSMRELVGRGVKLELLTNSLASTDEPSVHGGYLRYRKAMVELGVDIYELSPTLSRRVNQLGRFGTSSGALHAKVFVVDKKRLFVGSMNMDGRSERYNTELGVIIESETLAREFLGMVHFEASAYQLAIDPKTNEIEWIDDDGTTRQVLHDEPEVGWWRRMKARLLSDVVPEGWL